MLDYEDLPFFWWLILPIALLFGIFKLILGLLFRFKKN